MIYFIDFCKKIFIYFLYSNKYGIILKGGDKCKIEKYFKILKGL